ncbi:MAG: PhnD/SsuA/transferrin family substrate-binding protein [Hahellaceae bacterium]|nr:PhnD/SsuA/transferrin family substrate-binding protein [Hahellaceae bacterium]MCP5210694.1 PhnD/SsuA/transferrin family substrate-binding protein [Hahellaceae bacterium]
MIRRLLLVRFFSFSRYLLQRPCAPVMFALLAFLLGPGVVLAEEKLTIYFYNPETSINRNVVLKNTLDAYLHSQGDYQFQPVDNADVFEQLVVNDRSALFVMSSWQFEQLTTRASIVPVLRGRKEGRDTYRKLLVRDSQSKSALRLAGMTIATSGSESYSRSILRTMFPEDSAANVAKVNILVVPKDIDALMAVGFGLADAAMATELSLEKLSMLYRSQHQKLEIVGQSQPLKRLLVVSPQNPTLRLSQALQAVEVMPESEKGRTGLSMLGLDGWQRVSTEGSLHGRSQ